MPVNLTPPLPEQLLPVKGVALGIAEAGIRKPGRKDLLVIVLDESAKIAGVFTQNDFCAAPVTVAREHLPRQTPGNPIRALVINTGNANAGTGEDGLTHARATCAGLWHACSVAAASKSCHSLPASLWNRCRWKKSLPVCL